MTINTSDERIDQIIMGLRHIWRMGVAPEAADLLLALKVERADNEWQPIETAPKDGRRVIIFSVDIFYGRVAEGFYAVEDDGWVFSTSSDYQIREGDFSEPTHWMPLPEPPKEREAMEAKP